MTDYRDYYCFDDIEICCDYEEYYGRYSVGKDGERWEMLLAPFFN